MSERNYEVIKEGEGSYTIAEYDKGWGAYIINDGIYGYYWWSTRAEAQAAADAYNEYEGIEWLGQHNSSSDIVFEDSSGFLLSFPSIT